MHIALIHKNPTQILRKFRLNYLNSRRRGQGTRKGMPLLYSERAWQAAPCIVGVALAATLKR